MTLLTITASKDGIPLLAGELEDIVCQDVNFVPGDSNRTFSAELGRMSNAVRSDVRACLSRRGITVFVFNDEVA